MDLLRRGMESAWCYCFIPNYSKRTLGLGLGWVSRLLCGMKFAFSTTNSRYYLTVHVVIKHMLRPTFLLHTIEVNTYALAMSQVLETFLLLAIK